MDGTQWTPKAGLGLACVLRLSMEVQLVFHLRCYLWGLFGIRESRMGVFGSHLRWEADAEVLAAKALAGVLPLLVVFSRGGPRCIQNECIRMCVRDPYGDEVIA